MFIEELEDIDLEIHGVRLPIFPFSDELKNEVGIPVHYNNWEALEFLVEKGFEDRLAKGEIEAENLQGYRDRLDYEMGVIAPTDFGEYLLMVWDVVYTAQKNKIGIGPGRGSAASSLILYFLNVTDVDPLKYNLYFERFLSPSRTKANVVGGIRYYSDCPDVDIDISDTGRGRLIEILKEKYEGRFCKVSTHGTLQGKSCIKNVCKILLKYSEEESKYISNMIPSLHGKVFDLDKAREEEPKFEKFCKDNELAYTVAKKLYELIVSEGAHASAYLVPFKPLMGNVPLKLVKNKETGESELATAANMNYVQMENIKLDLLGLKAVSIIDDVCESVGITPKDFDISWDTVYSHLQNVETPYGLFQISGDCNLRVVNKVKPKNLDHMAAVVALARPGALQFVDQYAKFSNDGEIQSVHEFFDDVLSETGGLACFQEQSMRMCEKIGLSKEEGEKVRKVIGKKLLKEVGKWKDIIFQKAEENGLNKDIPEKLWRIINDSASYSFNKCACPYTTYVEVKGGIKKMKDVLIGEWILGYNVENECDEWVQVVDLIPGFANLVKVQIGSETIECSLKHKLLCEDGEMYPLSKIVEEGLFVILKEDRPQKPVILSGETYKESIDFEVNSPFHNFYANGIVVSNSHSVCYAAIGVYTTYLKWKYPQQFFLSCLKIAATRSDFTDQFDSIQRELPHFGIKLLGPDIVKSSENFEIDGENIRFGLKEIKGISDNSLSKLRSFLSKERSGKFDTFLAAKEAGLNIGVFCSLIQSGTFSDLSEDRTRIVLEACIWNKLSEKERNWCARNGEKYNFNLLAMMKDYLEWKDANGKKINKETRLNTLRKECSNYFNIYHQNRQYPQLADYYYEKTLLGFSYSQNLKDIFGAKNEWLRNISETKDFVPLKGAVELIATVSEIKEGKSKNGNKYFKMTLVDEKDTIQAMMLGDRLAAYVAAEKALPEEGDIVYIHGSSGGDIIWVNRMSLPKEKIFLKLRDLKKFEKETKEEAEKSVKSA